MNLGLTCSETPKMFRVITNTLAKEFNTFLSDSVVVPVPAEDFGNIAFGKKRSHNAHQVEVGHIQNLMFL